jgi:hypothetical protein
MKFNKILGAAAAVSLATAPVAAQAGTRAASSTLGIGSAQATAFSGARKSSKVAADQKLDPELIIAGLLIILGGICAAACGGGDDSPGT